jgi:hypothetical protein
MIRRPVNCFSTCASVRVALALAVAMLAIGCSEVDAPGTGQSATTAAPAAAAKPPAADTAAAAEPKTVADIFPAGGPRDSVINNCGSCHNLACAAIGQRSAERWDSLKEGHKDRVAGADLNAMFDYLKANFNATTPEPKISPRFLEGGCTPF